MQGSDGHSAGCDPEAGLGGPRVRAGSAQRVRAGRTWTGVAACRSVVLFSLLAAALALWSAPALALSQRGHVFSSSFGSEGSGDGQLLAPAGVAVSEATGEVYVVDQGNNRVEHFGAAGEFKEAWGWGVSDGKEEYERCTSACKAGLAGTGQAQFDKPEAIAVDSSRSKGDPSAGDVYVITSTTGSELNVIEKFSSSGTPIYSLKTNSVGLLGGVAVDTSGFLWVLQPEGGHPEIAKFSDAGENAALSGVPLTENAITGEEFGECGTAGFAVDAKGEAFYANHELQSLFNGACVKPAVIAKLAGSGELLNPALESEMNPGLQPEKSTAVAVDHSSGDVYIGNANSVVALAPDGSLIQRFGHSGAALTNGHGIAVYPAAGDVYVADAAKNVVDVFALAPAGAPTVDSVSAQDLTPTATELKAEIDPHGLETKYTFQFGTVNCTESPSSCTEASGGTIEGFGDQSVHVELQNLQPGTTYFYQVVAKNEAGKSKASQTVDTFTTLPNPAGLLPDHREWELVSPPDKHGAEIDPIGFAGVDGASGPIQASADGNTISYLADDPIVANPEGSRSSELTQVISTRGVEAWSSQDIVTPHNKGEGFPNGRQEYRLFSTDLSLGIVQPWGLRGTKMQEPPLVSGVSEEERGIYTRNNATCPASCYHPLVTPEDDNGAQFGGQLEFRGATPDLGHAVFTSEVALASQGPSAPGLYEWAAGKGSTEQLTLVSVLPGGEAAKSPELGNDNEGEHRREVRNAISNDGARVFFSDTGESEQRAGAGLYVRDTVKGKTAKINVPEPGALKGSKEEKEQAESELQEVNFQTASSDGSRVFFTDTLPLTKASKLEPREEGPADLYECELVEENSELKCKLTDLTVDSRFGEAAAVVGVLLGASEDGCDVGSTEACNIYFVANGVLASPGAPGHCARGAEGEGPHEGKCNLYVEHYNGAKWETRLIAELSKDDAPVWARDGEDPGELSSRVSPNGRYLAFMSDQPLTGYNNTDASSPPGEPRHDEEVFLYDASGAGHLVCASCRTGEAPHGVFDTEHSSEGSGLLVDRPAIWRDHWLAGSIPGWTPLNRENALYQSRYLSNEGRLFFDSPDALVPQDTNGKEDVYEYEPTGLGGCASSAGCVALISSGTSSRESAFIDASVSGADAFFITAQKLVAADTDNAFDLYDARVCTESSPCLKSSPPPHVEECASEESCRPPRSPQPGFEPPASESVSGPGNIVKGGTLPHKEEAKAKPLTRAQKLANALNACRKKWKHAKRKRAACEKQARKKYGAKKAPKPKRTQTSKQKSAKK